MFTLTGSPTALLALIEQSEMLAINEHLLVRSAAASALSPELCVEAKDSVVKVRIPLPVFSALQNPLERALVLYEAQVSLQ